jgi:hypothetical protein
MSSLALHVHNLEVETSMGAVVTLQQVANENGETMTRGRRIEVTIPANWGNSTHQVSVEAGRWLVEATLPSGEVITEEVAVASGEDLPVTVQSAEHSSHEWLALQYLVGNVEGAKTLTQLRDKPPGVPQTLPPKDAILPPGMDSAGRRTRASIEPPNVQTWQKQGALRGIEAWTNILSPDTGAFNSHAPIEEDSSEATWLYRITDAAQQRQFGHVEWLGERFAVSLPLPWRGVSNHQPVPVQVMVHMERHSGGSRLRPDGRPDDRFYPAESGRRGKTGSRPAVRQNGASSSCGRRRLCSVGSRRS